jgi:molybdenum cofactor synthesis domain-containing protein
MEVALVTVGEELLAGDVTDTNATWLAGRLADRGVTVRRIVTLPDDRAVIAEHVREYSEAFVAVVVTGGVGGTPDDVTVEAVADAFGDELAVSDAALAHVEATLEAVRDRVPDLDVDPEAEASIPAGGRAIPNPEVLAPGCVVENVYVLPGIPREMKATFDEVAEAFEGDALSTELYTVAPEGNIVDELEAVGERFPVAVGCYPDRDGRYNRLTVTAGDEVALGAAADWLREHVDATDDPVERDWAGGDGGDDEVD